MHTDTLPRTTDAAPHCTVVDAAARRCTSAMLTDVQPGSDAAYRRTVVAGAQPASDAAPWSITERPCLRKMQKPCDSMLRFPNAGLPGSDAPQHCEPTNGLDIDGCVSFLYPERIQKRCDFVIQFGDRMVELCGCSPTQHSQKLYTEAIEQALGHKSIAEAEYRGRLAASQYVQSKAMTKLFAEELKALETWLRILTAMVRALTAWATQAQKRLADSS